MLNRESHSLLEIKLTEPSPPHLAIPDLTQHLARLPSRLSNAKIINTDPYVSINLPDLSHHPISWPLTL